MMRRLHAFLFVSDMRRSVEFYRTLLRAEPAYESEHWTEFRIGDARLGLHKWTSDGSVPACTGARVFFEVDDLDAERGRLEKAGIRLRGEIVELEGAGRDLEFEDPDGHVLELWEPPRVHAP